MAHDLKERYTRALDSFVAKVTQDKYVLAVVLAGSLYHDVVWEKSDIDLILIVEDLKQPEASFSLVEDGIIINAATYDRRRFKRTLDTALRAGFFHSWLAKTTLLYTRDETIRELYDESMFELGDHDKSLLLLRHGCFALGDLAKAQKWLRVKHDVLYSYYWLVKSLDNLASIEVISQDGIPGREVIQQALAANAPFFRSLYVDLAQQPKDAAVMQEALERVEAYLTEKTPLLFSLLLDELAEKGATMGHSELRERLSPLLGSGVPIVDALEWLAEQGVIEKLSTPVDLTTKSRAFVDEIAYFYDRGNRR